jgi:hypothetical protein
MVRAANGTLDIAMNIQGPAVERATSTRRIFNSLHAAFSFRGARRSRPGGRSVRSRCTPPPPDRGRCGRGRGIIDS